MDKATFLPCYRCGSHEGLMVLKSDKIPCSCGDKYREYFVRCTLCSKPLNNNEKQQCERCAKGKDPFQPKPDTQEWKNWKLTHVSWAQWRRENPKEAAALKIAEA